MVATKPVPAQLTAPCAPLDYCECQAPQPQLTHRIAEISVITISIQPVISFIMNLFNNYLSNVYYKFIH